MKLSQSRESVFIYRANVDEENVDRRSVELRLRKRERKRERKFQDNDVHHPRFFLLLEILSMKSSNHNDLVMRN